MFFLFFSLSFSLSIMDSPAISAEQQLQHLRVALQSNTEAARARRDDLVNRLLLDHDDDGSSEAVAAAIEVFATLVTAVPEAAVAVEPVLRKFIPQAQFPLLNLLLRMVGTERDDLIRLFSTLVSRKPLIDVAAAERLIQIPNCKRMVKVLRESGLVEEIALDPEYLLKVINRRPRVPTNPKASQLDHRDLLWRLFPGITHMPTHVLAALVAACVKTSASSLLTNRLLRWIQTGQHSLADILAYAESPQGKRALQLRPKHWGPLQGLLGKAVQESV